MNNYSNTVAHLFNRLINKKELERLFLLSPLIILFFLVYNVENTKWLVSRAIIVTVLYCLYFYRDTVKKNWNNVAVRLPFLASCALFLYFTALHFYRQDEFDFASILLLGNIYLLCIPWRKIGQPPIAGLIGVAAIFCGINALHEFYVLNIYRVGVVTNPITFALFCGSLSLACFSLSLTNKNNKKLMLFLIAGTIFSFFAVILTSVRGIIIFLPILFIALSLKHFAAQARHHLAIFASLVIIFSCSYLIFQQQIENRILDTRREIAAIQQGNLTTSFGIRLNLWQHGIEMGNSNPLIGAGEKKVLDSIYALPRAFHQNHLHNLYIDTYARYGILGLLLLAAWLLSFAATIKKEQTLIIQFKPLKTTLLLLFLSAGLTDYPFFHTHIIMFFMLLFKIISVYEEENNAD
ncbi:MAG: O-antigen ligase family protein [Vibrionaceae bacterium]